MTVCKMTNLPSCFEYELSAVGETSRAHYATCQYKWAHELLLGERVLVARPRTVDDKSAWEEPREVACAAARETLKKYGKAALVGWAREAAEAWETALTHSA